jgi:phasin
VTRSQFPRQAVERNLRHHQNVERTIFVRIYRGACRRCLSPSVALIFERTPHQEFTGELTPGLRTSSCVVTREAVITNTNSNPKGTADKARKAYRKSSNRSEERLETPFPQAAREFAEKTVDQTREAYERFNRTLETAVQILEKSFDAAAQGAAALHRKIIDIAQRNLNLGFDLAKSLADARNFPEIVELQAAYWRKQFDGLTTQAEEVRNRVFGFGAAKPQTAEPSPESIHREPAKKAPPRAQETPKKGHSPAERDPAAERLKQKPDMQKLEAPPPVGPAAAGVRPPDKRQPGIRKQSTSEDKPKRLQRPTARDPAAERGKQKSEASRTKLKARPRSGPVAPPGVRPPDERQLGTRKKGAPEDEPVPESLAAEIKFGVLDGNAVRFTDLEAWWLVDGAWRPISPGEVLLNAAVMREARFNQLFPQVPRLPSIAFEFDDRQD